MPAIGAENCPACLGSAKPLSLVVDRHRLWQCSTCATQFFRADRADVAANSAAGYWEEYKFEIYGSPQVQQEFERRYDDVLSLATGNLGPIASVLDVGCGIGNFLDFARDRGMAAVGVDVDARAVSVGRDRGLQIRLPGELDGHVPPASVDAATMWDVVEHLKDPYEVVATMASRVRSGGALLFETPDGAFPVRSALLALHRLTRGMVDLTGPLYYLEHRIYFTLAGLRCLLERCGCEVVAVEWARSPRRKMSKIFTAEGREGEMLGWLLRFAWPALEYLARRLHTGNKLLVVARRLPAA